MAREQTNIMISCTFIISIMSHLLNDNVTFCTSPMSMSVCVYITLTVQRTAIYIRTVKILIKTQNLNYTFFLLNEITFLVFWSGHHPSENTFWCCSCLLNQEKCVKFQHYQAPLFILAKKNDSHSIKNEKFLHFLILLFNLLWRKEDEEV